MGSDSDVAQEEIAASRDGYRMGNACVLEVLRGQLQRLHELRHCGGARVSDEFEEGLYSSHGHRRIRVFAEDTIEGSDNVVLQRTRCSR